MSGPYYLECRNHDLCGHGGIKRLVLQKEGIHVELNRPDLSLSQRTVRVYRKFTAEELASVREMFKTIVSGYRCFVDET